MTPTKTFTRDDRVRHPEFGDGVILRINLNNSDLYAVWFDKPNDALTRFPVSRKSYIEVFGRLPSEPRGLWCHSRDLALIEPAKRYITRPTERYAGAPDWLIEASEGGTKDVRVKAWDDDERKAVEGWLGDFLPDTTYPYRIKLDDGTYDVYLNISPVYAEEPKPEAKPFVLTEAEQDMIMAHRAARHAGVEVEIKTTKEVE